MTEALAGPHVRKERHGQALLSWPIDISVTSEIAEAIRHDRSSGAGNGTVRIFGEWFGRPYDNWHRLTEVRHGASELELLFKEGERLLIISPHGLHVDEFVLRISRASHVRWEWFWPYEHTEGNRHFRAYTFAESAVSDDSRDTLSPNWRMPAVEIWSSQPE